jgi:hydrogenase-4 component B
MVFRATEHVDMPPPGDTGPARLTVELRDPVWDAIYAPIVVGIRFTADRFNRVQFLTIRQFLSLVFGALIILLLVLAVWS